VSKQASSPPQNRVGLLADVIREVRLVWRLLREPRVPAWTKLVPFAALLYILFPLDLVSDLFVGLGQLDDLAVLLLGMELFISLSPAAVVEQIRRELGFGGTWAEAQHEGQTVDSTARVVDEPTAGHIEGGKR
jgi:uncharacterized membrane protein YkvA (DUF1232 family)